MADADQGALLGDAERIPATTRGTLWGLPAGYPALSAGAETVHGELVLLAHPQILGVLDRYEGVDQGLYRRVEIEVTARSRPHTAWAYVMDHPRSRGGRRIWSGRWTATRRR